MEECLRSLAHLTYPRYEVIVVDDGSTDGTHAFAAQYGMRCLRVPNGGLSKGAQSGYRRRPWRIVAFIDADAYADSDWLYYLVTALEGARAAAVGGPNLSPPRDWVRCSVWGS